MAVGDARGFPGFLTPVLTQLSFQSHCLLFSHASAEVRGENTPERKVAPTGDRTRNHQVTCPTRSPLSHLGGAIATEGQRACHQFFNRNKVLSGSCHPWSPFNNFYTPVEEGMYYGITRGERAGGRRPLLCPEHISKTNLARVMKFHGWIDLIEGECSVKES